MSSQKVTTLHETLRSFLALILTRIVVREDLLWDHVTQLYCSGVNQLLSDMTVSHSGDYNFLQQGYQMAEVNKGRLVVAYNKNVCKYSHYSETKTESVTCFKSEISEIKNLHVFF